MFEFTDDYRTGIPTIDEEHAYLIQIVNDTHSLLSQDEVDIQILAKNLLIKLKNYANTHFQHEEKYMETINDPELSLQKKEHAMFIKQIDSLTVDDSLKVRDVEEIMDFLVRWLFRHILYSDMMIGKVPPAKNNDPFAFTAEFTTGIKLIDEEHKMLFDIIREANDLIHAEFLHDKYDEIVAILDQLRDYTKKHFADEEEYMKSINYPKLPEQKVAHTAFVEKLVNIDINQLDEIDDNQQQYLIDLIDYLLNWLTNHILKSDKLIGEFSRKL